MPGDMLPGRVVNQIGSVYGFDLSLGDLRGAEREEVGNSERSKGGSAGDPGSHDRRYRRPSASA
jgi:hypothetical protein